MKIDLTEKQAKALLRTIDMVLSITADIKKGDPDFEPLQQIYNKIASKSY